MSKKPNLTVVAPATTIAAPPLKLGNAGLNLWNRIQHEYEIADAGGVELLCQICCAADTIEMLSEQIAADGSVIRTARGTKPHPALRDVLSHRSFVARTLTKLGIAVEAVKSQGRPSTPTAWRPPQED